MEIVHNITDVLPGHAHPGSSSYSSYIQGCRAPSCLVAAQEYKLKLAQRKISGEYRDLRLRENKLRADAEQLLATIAADPELAEQFRRLLPDPESADPGTGPAAGQRESQQLPQARKTLGDGPVDPQDDQTVADDPGATEDQELSTDASRVLKYLTISRADARGRLNPKMTRMMSVVLQLDPDRCQAGLDELEEAGRLASDGTDLYLLDA